MGEPDRVPRLVREGARFGAWKISQGEFPASIQADLQPGRRLWKHPSVSISADADEEENPEAAT
jgi:hypothetical protein